MKARSVLLEGASTLLGVLAWWLGWPALRELNDALMIVGSIIIIVAVSYAIMLLILIIRSQLEPPYASKN